MNWQDHPLAPASGTTLCRRDEIEPGGVREFVFGEGPAAFRLIVVDHGGTPLAYVNSCPHFQIPMNSADGGFLVTGDVIWCAQHSAQFRFEDGYCIDGPCKGGRLDAVPLNDTNGTLSVG